MSSDWSGGGGSGGGGGVEFPGASGGHEVVHVEHVGFLSRLGSSIGGMLLGVALFFASFVVLYWNEGRPDVGNLANKAQEINASQPASAPAGKLVAAKGQLTTGGPIGDAYVAPGRYVRLTRSAQIYAWVEHKETKTEKQVGGSEKRTTRYSYTQEWTSRPERSSSFKEPAGHQNPSMSVEGATTHAEGVKVGALGVDPQQMGLPGEKDLALSGDTVRQGKASGGHIYLGSASPGSPRVGDQRLSYLVVPAGQEVTAFGKVEGDRLVAYTEKDQELYRAFAGGKEAAVSTMHGEHKLMTWILRLVGFLCMWGGLMLGLGPIHTLMDVLPFLGDLGRGLSGFMTFVVAFVLTLITIVVSMILHSFIAMVVIGLLVVVGAVAFLGKKKGLIPQLGN